MSKFSKVLSMLLAMVFVFSTMTIGVEAVSYKDEAITDYNAIGKPVLSTDQYASMAMDELDRMLQEANVKVDLDIGGVIVIKKPFTTIDESLDSIASTYNDLSSTLKSLKGDIAELNFDALLNAPRRGTTGEQDADIFRAVFQFLADNADIIAKVPYGSEPSKGIDLGPVLSGFLDLSKYLDVIALIKEPVAKLVWPNRSKSQLDLTKTLDEYVNILIDEVVSGTYPSEKGTVKKVSDLVHKYLPGINEEIDLLNDSVYDIFAKAFKIALNKVGVPMANRYLPVALGKFIGLSYNKSEDSNGLTVYTRDPENDDVNETLKAVVNTNFKIDEFDTSSWSNTNIIDHLNDIAGVIVKAAVNPSLLSKFTWVAGGNDKLVSNIISVAKVILNKTGNEFFASYVEVKTPEELDAMSEDQFIAYILRSIFNGSIDEVYIDNSVDTMEGVLFELVRSLAGSSVPTQSYYSMTPSIDNMIQIGLDIAAAGLNGVTDMNLAYGLDADAFATACMNWVTDNYAGFVSSVDGTGWTALSYVFNQIIPANWLPLRDGSERDNLYDILYTDIAENLINNDHKVKLDKILDLFKRNPTGELNGTLISMLLDRIVGIVNYVIPGTFPEGYAYDSLEGLLDKELLSEIIRGLINGLNDRVDSLMPSLLPVVCAALGLSSDESFGNPYINLEDITTLNPTVTTSFYMYNGSSGINTNTRDKTTGRFKTVPDGLYTYRINSVTTNIPGLNVSYSGNTINGSTAKTFTFNGVDLTNPNYEGQLLVVTISYDVYEEEGQKMTKNPLTATTYSVISSKKDDGDEQKRLGDANNKTALVVKYKTATYISTSTELNELNDITIDITRDWFKDSRKHSLDARFYVTRARLVDSSLSALGVSTNTSFSVNTTQDAGKWEWHPYVVSASNTSTLEPGIYEMQFTVNSEGTNDFDDSGVVSASHYIVVFDSYNLKNLVDRAVSANRQVANYASSGSFPASFIPFDMLGTEGAEADDMGEADASTAWADYSDALEAAALLAYTPRMVNNFGDSSYVESYQYTAQALYEATQYLEACSVSSGITEIQNALDEVIAPDFSDKVDSDGNPIRVEYDDPARTYFAREDYLSYTYGNFKSEKRAAENLINAVKDAEKKGESYNVTPVQVAYLAHRVRLYGDRLIRIVADTQHLAKAIQMYGNIQRGEYTAESWADYTRALAFANKVNAMTPAANAAYTNPNADNYRFLKDQNGGLRQSMVNEARGQLIKAAKKLVVSNTVDYAKLNAAIDRAKSIYNAGSEGWTALSWATFEEAYNTATKLVADNLDKTDANQTKVDNAADALDTAREELQEQIAEEGGFNFIDVDTLKVLTSDINENLFVTGLDMDDPAVSYYVESFGGYTTEVEVNEMGVESTGAILYVYDANGNPDPETGYMIVIFGDVNGDTMIGIEDAMDVLSYSEDLTLVDWGEFDEVDETAKAYSADVNHDYTVNVEDAMTLLDASESTILINQNWSYDNGEDPTYLID